MWSAFTCATCAHSWSWEFLKVAFIKEIIANPRLFSCFLLRNLELAQQNSRKPRWSDKLSTQLSEKAPFLGEGLKLPNLAIVAPTIVSLDYPGCYCSS